MSYEHTALQALRQQSVPEASSSISSLPNASVITTASSAESGATANAAQGKANPVWIDSGSKSHLKELMQEATVFTATNMNNPSVGLYHVQVHMKTKIPKIVQVGRSVGSATVDSFDGLRKDTQLGAETADGIAKIAAFHNISQLVSDGVAKIRRDCEGFLPTQQEVLASKKPEKKKGFFN